MKTWYTSKTLWLNLIAIAALVAQSINSTWIVSAEIQGAILAVINLILRTITNQSLDWQAGASSDETPPGPPATAGFISLRLLPLLAMAALLMLAAGCATTGAAPANTTTAVTAKDNPLALAGKSLLAVKSTITTAAIATDALCKAGKIGPDKCAQAKDAYNLAKPAYDSAVDAYLLMSQGYGDPVAFGAALQRVQDIAANLMTIAGGTP